MDLENLRDAFDDTMPRRWFQPDPNSKVIHAWDTITGCSLVFVAVFTPFEVGFLPAPTSVLDPLFALGRSLDVIFGMDMLLQFILPVPIATGVFRAQAKDVLETRPAKIARGYLRSWFSLDFLSLAASIFDVLPMVTFEAAGTGGTSTGTTTGSTKSPLSTLRTMRVLRLIKLARLLKGSRRLRDSLIKLPLPTARLTLLSALFECLFIVHWTGCIFGILTLFPDSPLDTWLATHGYCQPLDSAEDGASLASARPHECATVGTLYFYSVFWAAGMLMGAPISMTAPNGPFDEHYSDERGDRRRLNLIESSGVLVCKSVTALCWVTIIARFVQVYNELNPDLQAWKKDWDALNSFIAYFKVAPKDATELRRYYVERSDIVRARRRKQVISNFSPALAEKHVWKLNRAWLVKVPCFSLVVERLISMPDSGIERFLVRVAMKMQPEVYVPAERPPPQRLYIITEGLAMHAGRRLVTGDNWGARSTLLKNSSLAEQQRAVALTYLHVLWVSGAALEEIGLEGHKKGFLLTKLWAVIMASGDWLVDNLRKREAETWVVPIGIGEAHGQVPVAELERKLNNGLVTVEELTDDSGALLTDVNGRQLYKFKSKAICLDGYQLTRERHGKRKAAKFKLTEVTPALDVNCMKKNTNSCSALQGNGAASIPDGPNDPAAKGDGVSGDIVRDNGTTVEITPGPNVLHNLLSTIGLSQAMRPQLTPSSSPPAVSYTTPSAAAVATGTMTATPTHPAPYGRTAARAGESAATVVLAEQMALLTAEVRGMARQLNELVAEQSSRRKG